MESLSDPAPLADRDDVAVEETTTEVGTAEFLEWDSLAGLVAVGVPTDDGRILLMDGANGWALPNQPVTPEEDWVGVARRTIDQLTGVDVDIADAERVRRIEYVDAEDEDKRTTVHHVVLRAATVADDERATAFVTRDGEELPAVKWFDSAPGAEREFGDVDADVALFLD